MAIAFLQRHDVAANWLTKNPVLRTGEIGCETDTDKFKIGDGLHAWSSLPYYLSEPTITAYINSAVESVSPSLTPEELDEITVDVTAQVQSDLEISNLVILWENAKA